MADQYFSTLNFTLGYFLTPLFFLLLGCTALKFWIPRAGDTEKVKRRQSNTVGGSLLLLAILSFRALCILYNGEPFTIQAQLVAAAPLVALNLLYLRYCSPQLKFWILYGVGVLYVSLHLYVDHLRIVNDLYLICVFLLIYLQVFLTGEVYAYVSRLLIEFVTSNSRLPDERGVHTLITLSKYLLFYGYMGGAVIAVGSVTFVNGPLKESPVDLFLVLLFLPFFPDMHPFTKGFGELFSKNPVLCIDGEGAPDLPQPDERGSEVTLRFAKKVYKRLEDAPEHLQEIRSEQCLAVRELFRAAKQEELKSGNAFLSAALGVGEKVLTSEETFSCVSVDSAGEVQNYDRPRPEGEPVAELFVRGDSLHDQVEENREPSVAGTIKSWIAHQLVSSVTVPREGAMTVKVYKAEGPTLPGGTEG